MVARLFLTTVTHFEHFLGVPVPDHFWDPLGALGAILEPLGGQLGPLGATWATWDLLGHLEPLGTTWDHLGPLGAPSPRVLCLVALHGQKCSPKLSFFYEQC